MPVVCTLLFGFSGAFFGAVASAGKHEVGEFVLSFSGAVNPDESLFVYPRKWLVLIVSGLASLAFYFSVINAIYSKLVDPLPSQTEVDAATRSDDQKETDKLAFEQLVSRQNKYRSDSIGFFNAGVALLPLSGLFFLKYAFASWAITFYLCYLAYALVLKPRLRPASA